MKGRHTLGRARTLLGVSCSVVFLLAFASSENAGIVSVFHEPLDDANYVVRVSYRPEAPGPVTLTVRFDLLNVTPNRPVPMTLVLRQSGEFELVKLTRMDLEPKWSFDYDSHWLYGDREAHHRDAVYRLPFAPGVKALVSQGFHGSFTHKGREAYAVDFKMPQGTSVCAARKGRVIDTRDDVTTTVRSRPAGYEGSIPANEIFILHDDGTVGRYMHFMPSGVRVSPGQFVRAGDVIGLSGDTGLSRGPHLHFEVYRPVDGYVLETLPVRFRVNGEPGAVELREGRTYEAR